MEALLRSVVCLLVKKELPSDVEEDECDLLDAPVVVLKRPAAMTIERTSKKIKMQDLWDACPENPSMPEWLEDCTSNTNSTIRVAEMQKLSEYNGINGKQHDAPDIGGPVLQASTLFRCKMTT
jgi:hypothetical protein